MQQLKKIQTFPQYSS